MTAADHETLYAALRARAGVGWEQIMQIPPMAADAPPGSYPDLSNAILFGDLWQRPELSQRERRLIVLTLLAVYGRDEPMAYHLRGALRSGDLDEAALDALVVQLAFYAGWPTASTIWTAVRNAVTANDIENAESAEPAQTAATGPHRIL